MKQWVVYNKFLSGAFMVGFCMTHGKTVEKRGFPE